MKYKVEYCGFVIVETDNAQEALEKNAELCSRV